MKIAEADVIKNGEQELIDAITGDLDWSTIERLLLEKHKFKLQDEVEYRNGDIVVHENAIAYRLDFDVKVSLSVLFNRNGDCLDLATSGEIEENEPANQAAPAGGGDLVPDSLETIEGDGDAPASSYTGESDHVSEMELLDDVTDGNAFEGDPGNEAAGISDDLDAMDDGLMELMTDEDADILEPVVGVDLDESDLDMGPMFDDGDDLIGGLDDDSDFEGSDPGAVPMMDGAVKEGAELSGGSDMIGDRPEGDESPKMHMDGAGRAEAPPLESTEHISQMASQIAEMISEINDK